MYQTYFGEEAPLKWVDSEYSGSSKEATIVQCISNGWRGVDKEPVRLNILGMILYLNTLHSFERDTENKFKYG